jgi:hypothetical protein
MIGIVIRQIMLYLKMICQKNFNNCIFIFLADKNIVFRVVNNVSIHDDNVLNMNSSIYDFTAKFFS